MREAYAASSYSTFNFLSFKDRKTFQHYTNNTEKILYFTKKQNALNVIDSTIKKIAKDVAKTTSDIKTLESALSSIKSATFVDSTSLSADLNVDIDEKNVKLSAAELKFRISTLLISRSHMISKDILNTLNLADDKNIKGAKTAIKSFYSNDYSITLTFTA